MDTNIVAEALKPKPHPGCLSWLEARIEDCSISALLIAEMRWGIERLPYGKKRSMLERHFELLTDEYQARCYEFTGAAAYEWGRYAAELEGMYGLDWWKQFDFRDTQLAAIAREYGLTIASRNVKHFPFCQVENPFESDDACDPPAA